MSEGKKFGIISYPDSRNKGDEVQSIAAARLLDRVDSYVPRNGIHKFKSEEIVNLICNGWFSTDTNAWPPSSDLNPLFVSFHATKDNDSHNILIREKYKDYYKQFEPIGCRDQDTANKFKSIGVDAYFSGCITLTLDNPFGDEVEREGIYIVDPFYKFNYDKAYVKYCLNLLIPKKYRKEVIYKTHWRNSEENLSVADKFKESEELLNQYAKAKLVITSRIHCALPCLAMNTPVIFVDMGYDTTARRDRFKGILELFNTIDGSYFPMSKNKLYLLPFRKLRLYKLMKPKKALKINWENPAANPQKHLSLRSRIKEIVSNFKNRV